MCDTRDFSCLDYCFTNSFRDKNYEKKWIVIEIGISNNEFIKLMDVIKLKINSFIE